jgi:hypothetical protein
MPIYYYKTARKITEFDAPRYLKFVTYLVGLSFSTFLVAFVDMDSENT